jgi:hypothetical protein
MSTNRLALLATLAFAGGCNLDTGNRPNVPPSLGIVNAAHTTTRVNLHVDMNEALTNVPIPPGTVDPGCPFILNGNHVFDFVQNDTLYSTVQGSLVINATYTAILVDAITASDTVYRTIVAGDDVEQASAGNNGIRIINGTSSPGDVYVTGINDDPTAATRVLSNLAPAATTTSLNLSFHMLPTTATRVRLFDVGSTTTPRSDILLTNTDTRRLTTVIFMPRSQPADQGGIQVNACN